jgi:phospholipase C
VRIELQNTSPQPVRVAIQDNSYRSETVTKSIGPDQTTSAVLNLKRSYGWYDFTVKVDGADGEIRYAGRVENGMSGFSDPLMGGVVQTV